MDQFLLGAIAMGFVIAGLMFLRFFRQTRDSLFLLFAVAFWIEALNRTVLALGGGASEGRTSVFLLRLLAYAFLVAGIVAKNLPRRARAPEQSGG